MKKYSIHVILFWLVFGIFVSGYSYYKLGIGKLNKPGPGLMPFLIGFLFSIISLYLLIDSIFKSKGREEGTMEEKVNKKLGKVGLTLAALFFYGFFIEILGYLIVTLLTMVLLFWGMGLKKWRSLLFASGLTVIVTYFLFTYLGVRFPPGILRAIGMY